MHSVKNLLRDFARKEDGLVTVEWVALAAALVIGAITIGWLVMSNMKMPANKIGTQINSAASEKLPDKP